MRELLVYTQGDSKIKVSLGENRSALLHSVTGSDLNFLYFSYENSIVAHTRFIDLNIFFSLNGYSKPIKDV